VATRSVHGHRAQAGLAGLVTAAAIDNAGWLRTGGLATIDRRRVRDHHRPPGGQEMITPTMKLKRAPIAANYADVIEPLYAGIGEPVQAGPDGGRKCTGLGAA
jgi:hypothetical protein